MNPQGWELCLNLLLSYSFSRQLMVCIKTSPVLCSSYSPAWCIISDFLSFHWRYFFSHLPFPWLVHPPQGAPLYLRFTIGLWAWNIYVLLWWLKNTGIFGCSPCHLLFQCWFELDFCHRERFNKLGALFKWRWASWLISYSCGFTEFAQIAAS